MIISQRNNIIGITFKMIFFQLMNDKNIDISLNQHSWQPETQGSRAWRDGHLHPVWLQKELHEHTLLLKTLSSELLWRKAAWGEQSSSRGSERPEVTWILRQTFWKPKDLSFNKARASQTSWRWSTRYGWSSLSSTDTEFYNWFSLILVWWDSKQEKDIKVCCCLQGTLIAVDLPLHSSCLKQWVLLNKTRKLQSWADLRKAAVEGNYMTSELYGVIYGIHTLCDKYINVSISN